MNPQHTVPTIVDDGFALWESRAISRYLVNKYGGDSTLYPEDVKERALVDQRLDFDLGTLYPRFAQYFVSDLTLLIVTGLFYLPGPTLQLGALVVSKQKVAYRSKNNIEKIGDIKLFG